MARRDVRTGLRTLAVSGGAIALGVAALVAVASFRASVEDAVGRQGREMLGADAVLSSRQPFPDSVTALLDSLSTAGTRIDRTTGFPSMVLAPRSGGVQLLEVRGIGGGWPFYGTVATDPPGAWAGLARGAAVLDPEAAAQLSVSPGDTIRLGHAAYPVSGIATALPGRSATGFLDRPKVYVGASTLGRTGLVQRGSLVTYRAYLAGAPRAGAGAVETFLDAHRDVLRRTGVRATTPAREQERLTGGIGYGTRFLGLVGLAALLLGGVGVASGARVLASTRLRSAAVLRCLGASQGSILSAYLLETLALAAVASALGAGAGIGTQAGLGGVLAGLLPVPVPFRLHAGAVAAGFGVGAGSALVFALVPLLDVRGVPALAALRRAEGGGAEGPRRHDPWRWAAVGLLAMSVAGLCAWQAPTPLTGLAYATGLGLLCALLAGVGRGLASAARRLLPRRAPYAFRQGVSNLFRPRNQTLAVVVALGLGAFLIGTLTSVEGSLLRRLRLAGGPNRPDLVLFDVQPDQKADLLRLMAREGHPELDVTPIVVLRIAALDGVEASRLRAEASAGDGGDRPGSAGSARGSSETGAPQDTAESEGSGAAGSGRRPAVAGRGRRGRPERWALGREYRSTWRDSLTATERLVAGRWWTSPWTAGAGTAQVSLSTDIASDLGVSTGDSITWQVGGRRIPTVVTSLRDVDWARPALNFFAVFQPGALQSAPATWVVLTRISDAAIRTAFQRRVVERFPTISAVDLSQIEAAVHDAVGTVAAAVRFMTLFSVGAGLLILVAAVGTSRRQRLREAVLLRTLGARASTIRAIHLTEYAWLGGLGGLAGTVLAGLAGWALVSRVFGLPYAVPWTPLALVWGVTVAAAVLIGTAAGGRTIRRPPLEVLRALEE